MSLLASCQGNNKNLHLIYISALVIFCKLSSLWCYHQKRDVYWYPPNHESLPDGLLTDFIHNLKRQISSDGYK